MEKQNKNQDNLSKLLKVFKADNIISSEEMEQVLAAIVSILAENKKSVEGLNAETKQQITEILNSIADEHSQFMDSVQKDTTKSKSDIEKLVKEQTDRAFKNLQALIAKIKLPKDGKDGKDGISADEKIIVEKVLEKIKLPEQKEVILEDIIAVSNEPPSNPRLHQLWIDLSSQQWSERN